MGPEGAVNILYRQQLAESDDPDTERQQLVDEYNETYANPYIAAERGYIDDVIMPSETRRKLVEAFDLLETKCDRNPPKKHGNIPL